MAMSGRLPDLLRSLLLAPTNARGIGSALVSSHTAKWMQDSGKKPPMELINEVPPIKVEGRIVACEGDSNPALGHPICCKSKEKANQVSVVEEMSLWIIGFSSLVPKMWSSDSPKSSDLPGQISVRIIVFRGETVAMKSLMDPFLRIDAGNSDLSNSVP